LLIIFDLDDTLIQTTKCLSTIRFKVALEAIIQEGFVSKDVNKDFNKLLRLRRSCASSLEAFDTFLFESGQRKANFLTIAEQKLYYDDLPQEARIQTFQGVKKTLASLHKKHILCLMTIGKRAVQLKKMEKAGIDTKLFSKIIVAKRGSKKKFYAKLISSYQLQPKQVIVCGDRVDKDLIPAKELGCMTLWMNKTKKRLYKGYQSCIDHTLDRFSQILTLITH